MQAQIGISPVLDRIRDERSAFAALIASIPDDRLAVPGAAGEWSVKDILIHVTWWEARMLEKLHGNAAAFEQIAQDPETGLDRLNDTVYREFQDRPAAEVKLSFQSSLQPLLDSLRQLPEADLLANQTFIGENTYEHYVEHMSGIRSWLAGV